MGYKAIFSILFLWSGLHAKFDEIKCRDFARIQTSSYTLVNNVWGRKRVAGKYRECIFLKNSKGGWFWYFPYSPLVKAYPEAIYGKKFSRQYNMKGVLPIKISQLKKALIQIDYDDFIKGRYNIAFESWVHKTSHSSMRDIAYEIMVRLDPKGVIPAKRFLFSKVTIDGIAFDVYKKRVKGRYFYNFVVNKKMKRITIDFKKILDYLKKYDKTCENIDNYYFNDVEMGVEVIYGKGELVLNKFDVNIVKKGAQ